eukprot:1162619-Ditylum_brightwellii.AAC.1
MGTTSILIKGTSVSPQNILKINMVELEKWRIGACQQKRYPTGGHNTPRPQTQQQHTEKKKP